MTYQYKIIYKEHSRLFGETTSMERIRAHSIKKAISKFRTNHRYEDMISIDGHYIDNSGIIYSDLLVKWPTNGSNMVDPRITGAVNGS